MKKKQAKTIRSVMIRCTLCIDERVDIGCFLKESTLDVSYFISCYSAAIVLQYYTVRNFI